MEGNVGEGGGQLEKRGNSKSLPVFGTKGKNPRKRERPGKGARGKFSTV